MTRPHRVDVALEADAVAVADSVTVVEADAAAELVAALNRFAAGKSLPEETSLSTPVASSVLNVRSRRFECFAMLKVCTSSNVPCDAR